MEDIFQKYSIKGRFVVNLTENILNHTRKKFPYYSQNLFINANSVVTQVLIL